MLGEKLHDKSIYVRSEAFKLVYGKKLGGSWTWMKEVFIFIFTTL